MVIKCWVVILMILIVWRLVLNIICDILLFVYVFVMFIFCLIFLFIKFGLLKLDIVVIKVYLYLESIWYIFFIFFRLYCIIWVLLVWMFVEYGLELFGLMVFIIKLLFFVRFFVIVVFRVLLVLNMVMILVILNFKKIRNLIY